MSNDVDDFFSSKENTTKRQKEIVDESCARAGQKLNDIDKVLLYSFVYTNNKQGLSALSIANFVNFQISSTGKLKPLKTKAFDKSKKMLSEIEKKFKNEAKEVIKDFQNKC